MSDLNIKPTNCNNLLHVSHFHPVSFKKGILVSQLIEMKRICEKKKGKHARYILSHSEQGMATRSYSENATQDKG